MAKRRYTGKPSARANDMKVRNVTLDTKHTGKLKAEYNKLKGKQKYPYIQTNYFEPFATFTLSGSLDLTAASTITMSSTNGTEIAFKGVDGSTNTSARTFKANGTAENASNGIADIINSKMAGKISASVSSEQVVFTQAHPGPDGNTRVTITNIAESVHLAGGDTVIGDAGQAANNSGSAGNNFRFAGG